MFSNIPCIISGQSLITPSSEGIGMSAKPKTGSCNANISTSYNYLSSLIHGRSGRKTYPGTYMTGKNADYAVNTTFSHTQHLDAELASEYAAFFYSGNLVSRRFMEELPLATSMYRFFAAQAVDTTCAILKNATPAALRAWPVVDETHVKMINVETLTLASVCEAMILKFHITIEPAMRNKYYAQTETVSAQQTKQHHPTCLSFAVARTLLGLGDALHLKQIIRRLGKFPYGANTVSIEFVPFGYTAEEVLWMWAALHVHNAHYDVIRIWLQTQIQIQQHNPIDIDWSKQKIASVMIEQLNTIDYLPFLEPVCEGNMDSDKAITLIEPPSLPPAESAGSTGVATTVADNTAIETGTEDIVADVIEEEASLNEVCEAIEDEPAVFPLMEHRFGKVINANMTTATIQGAQFLNIVLPQTALRALDSTPQALLFKQEAYAMVSMKIKIVSNCSKFQQGAALASFLYSHTQRDFNNDLLNLRTLFTAPRILLNGSFATSGEMHIAFEHPQPLIATIQNNWTTELDVGNLILTCVDPVATVVGSSPAINYIVYVSFEMCKLFGKRGFYTPWVPIPCVAPTQGDSEWVRDLTRECVESNPGPGGMLAVVMKKAVFTHVAKPVVSRLKGLALSAVNEAENKLLGCLGEDADRDKPSALTSDTVFQTTMHSMSAGVGQLHVTTHRLDPAGTTTHPKEYVGVDRKFQHSRFKTMYGLQEIFEWPATAVVNTRLYSTRVQPGQYVQTIFGGTLPMTTSNTPVDFLADNYEAHRGSLRYKFTIVATGMHTGKLRATYEPEVQQTAACDNQGVKFEVFELGADLDGNVTYGFDIPYQTLLLMQPMTEANAVIKGGGRLLGGVLSIFVENPLVAPATVSNRVRVIVEKRGYDNFETAVPGPLKTRFTAVQSNTFTNRISIVFPVSSTSTTITARRSDGGILTNASFVRPNPGFYASISINVNNPVKWDTQNIVQGIRNVNIYHEDSQRVAYVIQPNTNPNSFREGYRAAASISAGCSFTEGGFWNGNASTGIGLVVAYIALPTMRGDMDSRYDEPTHMTDSKKSAMITPIQTGEDHMKIKAMLRRHEPWYKFTTYAVEEYNPFLCNVSLPCSFGSPVNRNLAEEYMKFNKITSFHDIFRFSRGAVRFVIAFFAVKGDIKNCLAQTTHIPFEEPTITQETQFGSLATNALGYATEIHSLDKNPVISLEIPHYLLGRKNYNSSYTSVELLTKMMNSLGNLKITVLGPSETEVKAVVYRAIGDDLLMSVLNGLPNRIIDDIPFLTYVGNTRLTPVVPAAASTNEGWIPDLTEEGIEPNPGPFKSDVGFSILGSDFSRSMKSIGTNADKVGSLAAAIEVVIRKDERLIVYADILLQVGHVMMNPSLPTFTLALTSITLKVIPTILLKQLGSRVTGFCNKLFQSSNMEGNMEGEGKTMADDVWDCIGEFFNVRPNIRMSWVKKFNLLMKMTTMVDKIISFIESILFAFKVFLNKLYQLYDKDGHLFKIIMDSEVIKCCVGYNNLVAQLTDQSIFRKITCSKKNIAFCFTTRRYGRVMANNLLVTRKMNPNIHHSVSRSNVDMDKLCAKLLAFSERPLVRREPFCMYMFGSAGIGKSYTATRLIMSLLNGANVPIHNDPIFVKSSGTKFMDGYQDQPAFLYDDFAAINDNEAMEFGEFIALKSSNYYQGNFSSVDEKQRPVHPVLLFALSNLAMPDNNMVQTHAAFLRRRDMLVHAELSPNFKHCSGCVGAPKGLGCKHCFTKNQVLIGEGNHVRFTLCNAMTGQPTKTVYTGLVNFEKFIGIEHKRYYDNETKNMLQRLNAMTMAITASEECNKYDKLQKDSSVTSEFLVEQLESHNLNIKVDQDFVDVFNKLLQSSNVALIDSQVLDNSKFAEFPEVMEKAGDFFEKGTTGDSVYHWAGGAAALVSVAACRFSYRMYKRVQRRKCEYNCICTFTEALEAMKPQLEAAIALDVFRDPFQKKKFSTAEPSTSTNVDEAEEEGEVTRNLSFKWQNGMFRINGTKFYTECDKCLITHDKSTLSDKYGLEFDAPCICTYEGFAKGIHDYYQSGRFIYVPIETESEVADTFKCYKIMCDTCSTQPVHMHLLMNSGMKHGYNGPKSEEESSLYELSSAIGFAISLIATLVYAFKILSAIYSLIFPTKGDSGDSDYAEERKKMLAQRKKEKNETKRARKYMRYAGDSEFDVATLYRKNLVVMVAGPHKTRGVAIAGTNIMTTQHWLEYFESEGTCTIDGGKSIRFEDVEIKRLNMEYKGEIKYADVVLLKFNGIPPKRNIVQHFVSEEELERDSVPVKVQYEDARSDRTIMGLSIADVNHKCFYDGRDRFVSGWEYDFNAVGVDYEVYRGGCMSALIDNIHKQIIGFHVASGPKMIINRVGYAQCITREMLHGLLGVDGVKENESLDLNYLYAEDFTVSDVLEPMLALKPYISVQASLVEPIRHVTYSDFKPSPMFGLLTEEGKQPVVFRTVGEAFPGVVKMEEAVNKNVADVKISHKSITRARVALKHKILGFVPTYKVKQWRSTTESIEGVIGQEFMRPQVAGSANGIPLRQLFPVKKDTYKRIGKRLFLNTMCVDLHERNMAMRYDSKCPPTAFQVCLKDELKSAAKIGNPREIDCSPTEYTQAVRKFTLDFSGAFYENNLNTFSAVGMNCLGSDWQKLCRKLRWHDNIMAGDVSAFGPTLPHPICENVWASINHWYDHKAEHCQQSNAIRNVLCKESLTSVKVAYNTVFKTNASSPSGLGITTIVNTCSMWQYLYIGWCHIVEEWYEAGKDIEGADVNSAVTVEFFEQYVDAVIYGDDLICSVDPTVAEMFNNVTLAAFFLTIGLKYTDGAKKTVTAPFVKLSEATFLGRAFTTLKEGENDLPVGALDITLIRNIVNWTRCRNSNNMTKHMLSSTQSALIEMMYHGRKEHTKAYGILQKYWQSEGREVVLYGYTFDELYERWCADNIREDEKLTLDCGDQCMSQASDSEQSPDDQSSGPS